MKPARRGARVRVIETDLSDDYQVGEVCIVSRVDSDGTFKGRSALTGEVKGWLRWDQVAPAGERVGWDFLAQALSPASRQLLEAFDGHTELVLSTSVEEAILLDLPGLEAALRAALEKASHGAPPAEQSPKPGRRGTSRRGATAAQAEAGPQASPGASPPTVQEDFDVDCQLSWGNAP